MARNRETPLWNQDLVLAVGLAIAGIGMLQGKLFPAADLNFPVLDRVLHWRMLAWWPLLLIVSGVVLWVRKVRAHSPAKRMMKHGANWRQ